MKWNPGIVCLADATQNLPSTNLIISGWGTISVGGAQSPTLKSAFVNSLTKAACQSRYPREKITGNHICTTSSSPDFCKNDIGGKMPFVNFRSACCE
jgi:hypothetical protein